MPASAASNQQAALEILREACARNAASDLQYEDRTGGLVSARARLISMDDDQVYLDQATSLGRPVRLQTNQKVTVYFLLNGRRYAFHTHAILPQCYLRLNAEQRVPGMALAAPNVITEQQRRGDFRISLAGYEKLDVLVHGGTLDGGGAARIDAPRYVGRILNVSAGGLGALFERCSKPRMRAGDLLFLSFSLPEMENSFAVASELRFIRAIHDGQSTVTGFKFMPWSLVPMPSYCREIARFIAAAQRRQLKRGR